MGSPPLLRYRAGAAATAAIRAHGLTAAVVGGLAGPASGPKWLVLAGLDRALLASGLLAPGGRPKGSPRPLLVGASAGAWRALVLASDDPAAAHAELESAYIGQVFARGVPASEVSAAYRTMLEAVFPARRVAAILAGERGDVAVHLTRVRGPAGARLRWPQGLAMAAAAALNLMSARTQRWLFERVLLHSRPEAFAPAFAGRVARLDGDNFQPAALATGSVPLYMQPVEGIAGAPAGRYLDGGLADYHLVQPYLGGAGGVVLFPHFQERIVPNWFDRYTRRRRPSRAALANVLQIFPTADFVAGLPDHRIPTRQDFLDFADRPAERIGRWRTAAAESDRLGDQLLADLEGGRIGDLLEPL